MGIYFYEKLHKYKHYEAIYFIVTVSVTSCNLDMV